MPLCALGCAGPPSMAGALWRGGTAVGLGARLGTPAPTAREASSIAEVDNHDVPVRCDVVSSCMRSEIVGGVLAAACAGT